MKNLFYDENALRKDIINAICKEPKLGVNYIDWHNDEGECGLTLIMENGTFDIIINKQR